MTPVKKNYSSRQLALYKQDADEDEKEIEPSQANKEAPKMLHADSDEPVFDIDLNDWDIEEGPVNESRTTSFFHASSDNHPRSVQHARAFIDP